MTMQTKQSIDDSTPLKRFLRESGLKFRAISRRADLSQSVFYAIVGGERAVKIDEAHAIVTALREMTGQSVTIEQLWPNDNQPDITSEEGA